MAYVSGRGRNPNNGYSHAKDNHGGGHRFARGGRGSGRGWHQSNHSNSNDSWQQSNHNSFASFVASPIPYGPQQSNVSAAPGSHWDNAASFKDAFNDTDAHERFTHQERLLKLLGSGVKPSSNAEDAQDAQKGSGFEDHHREVETGEIDHIEPTDNQSKEAGESNEAEDAHPQAEKPALPPAPSVHNAIEANGGEPEPLTANTQDAAHVATTPAAAQTRPGLWQPTTARPGFNRSSAIDWSHTAKQHQIERNESSNSCLVSTPSRFQSVVAGVPSATKVASVDDPEGLVPSPVAASQSGNQEHDACEEQMRDPQASAEAESRGDLQPSETSNTADASQDVDANGHEDATIVQEEREELHEDDKTSHTQGLPHASPPTLQEHFSSAHDSYEHAGEEFVTDEAEPQRQQDGDNDWTTWKRGQITDWAEEEAPCDTWVTKTSRWQSRTRGMNNRRGSSQPQHRVTPGHKTAQEAIVEWNEHTRVEARGKDSLHPTLPRRRNPDEIAYGDGMQHTKYGGRGLRDQTAELKHEGDARRRDLVYSRQYYKYPLSSSQTDSQYQEHYHPQGQMRGRGRANRSSGNAFSNRGGYNANRARTPPYGSQDARYGGDWPPFSVEATSEVHGAASTRRSAHASRASYNAARGAFPNSLSRQSSDIVSDTLHGYHTSQAYERRPYRTPPDLLTGDPLQTPTHRDSYSQAHSEMSGQVEEAKTWAENFKACNYLYEFARLVHDAQNTLDHKSFNFLCKNLDVKGMLHRGIAEGMGSDAVEERFLAKISEGKHILSQMPKRAADR